MVNADKTTVAIVGLGYVGLPLAVEFGKHFRTIGFDINSERVDQLRQGEDVTLEVAGDELLASKKLELTDDPNAIRIADVYIIAVPTPIDDANKPNLAPLQKASECVGKVISKGDVVIYEATVYPGCTEEDCIPMIESVSGLTYQVDFFAGYSPERINPGDKKHRISDILKVTSGCNEETAEFVDQLYKRVIKAGTYKAQSIRVAEAAKVIENTQRDLNIALVNELAIIFDKLGIDTQHVLQAAATKWNFLPFQPGLVGGHCISVDPYYLTHKAQQIGYHPEVILSGRKINDGMGEYVAESVIKLMLKKRIHILDARVLVMGLAFKENCPDVRNTRVVDIIEAFQDYHVRTDVCDPWVSQEDAIELIADMENVELIKKPAKRAYDAIIVCVGHDQFKEMDIDKLKSYGRGTSVLYDVKSIFPAEDVDGRL
ncbi:MAG: nucleotide sugar dehydrogenase [Pseudomonadota bacterium]